MFGCVRLFAAVALVSLSTVAAGDKPPLVSAEEFLSGEYDFRLVRAKCIVKDAFRDEINPDYAYLTLLWDNKIVYAAVKAKTLSDDEIAALIGAGVTIEGQPQPRLYDQREKLGRNFQIKGPEFIKVVTRATEDPFDVPDISTLEGLGPGDLQHVGRRRFRGRVLAVWNKTSALISGLGKFDMPETLAAKFVAPPAPAVGEEIEVSGFPETDIHHYTLVRARWRGISAAVAPSEAATDITARDMTTDETGRARYRHDMHGKTVRMRGTVRSIHDPGGRLLLDDDGILIPVDISAAADAAMEVSPGCTVEATGVCVMDTENWQMNSVFPQIKGFFIVTRAPGDLRIVSRPAWWTATRLLVVIGTLFAALVAILIWNAALRRAAARKGRELFREQIGRVEADLRTEERTRLAVELHDSLAQNLTGVSMEISAAQRLLPESAPSAAMQHLEFASNAIASSRDELRNCLWDLRGEALDQPDMEKAVEFSIRPHVGDTSVAIRFRVPRARLSDALAHATLRIVRELTINAIRHGGAKTIRIAGCIDGDLLKFSVSDDGCGFDPQSAPSIDQGHFGLQGIRERVDSFGGSISIDSSPGRGTRVNVTVAIEGEEEDNPE